MASIRQRGDKYAVLARVGGKQPSRTFHTQRDAQRFQNLVHALGNGNDSHGWQKAIDEMFAEQTTGLTLDQLAEQFFMWKTGDVEARTIADYRRDYTNWIQPFLGHRQAEAIDERDVQALVDGWVNSGKLEAKSIADRHMILGSIYRYGSARSRQLVTHNPCQETHLPKKHRKPPKGVTIAEWKALHAAALEVNPDAADLMLFIVSTGWRFSEATAIRVREVEEAEKEGRLVLYVTMRAVFRRGGGNDYSLAEDAAKSDAGIRRVVLPATTAHMIGRRVVGKGQGDFVFTNPAGNPWRQNNFLYRTWPSILRKAELERHPTPHWLRHTQVALLDRAQVSLPEMQRRLGHENIETTINTYGRMIDDMSLDSLDKLDALLADHGSGQIVAGQVVERELPS